MGAPYGSVTKLDLYDNQLGDEGLKAIASMLASNKKLRVLNLKWNGLGKLNQVGGPDNDAGVKVFAAVLKKNKTIEQVNLVGVGSFLSFPHLSTKTGGGDGFSLFVFFLSRRQSTVKLYPPSIDVVYESIASACVTTPGSGIRFGRMGANLWRRC
jgi:hypothetical protein